MKKATTTIYNINETFHTSGDGYWSNEKKAVTIQSVHVVELEDISTFMVNVIFDTNDWNTEEDGLIYTDPQALSELKTILADHIAYDFSELKYTEQGMQGSDSISLEVDKLTNLI